MHNFACKHGTDYLEMVKSGKCKYKGQEGCFVKKAYCSFTMDAAKYF